MCNNGRPPNNLSTKKIIFTQNDKIEMASSSLLSVIMLWNQRVDTSNTEWNLAMYWHIMLSL